jgi:comEA protein
MRNKKLELAILAITLVFAAFTAGFFSGRASVRGSFTVETGRVESTDAVPETEKENTGSEAAVIDRSIPDDSAGLININSADAVELSELPGIGEVLAQRIIEYRETNGGFESIDELKNVSGIGDAIFDGVSPLITVG